jgi:hypothetical protein
MHDFLYSSSKNNFRRSPLSCMPAGNMSQISKQLLTIKPAFVQQRFADLDFFRQRIEESKAGLHHQPYTYAKKNTSLYKAIFLAIAAIFFLFNITVMSIPTALGCGFVFSSCKIVKGIVVIFCTFLSIAAFTLGIRLKAEKEAIAYQVKKVKIHLKTIYERKKLLLGVNSIFSFLGSKRKKAKALKHAYDEACDNINDKKDEALHLTYRIATAETLEMPEKEALLNQAIEEFSEKLHKQIQIFRHLHLS